MAFKKKEECPKPPAWLTSFSDLMSLLLTFFILLYAMSTLDIPSLEKFLSYFRKNPEFYPKRTSIVEPINYPKNYAVKIKERIRKTLPPWAYQIIHSEEYVKLRLFNSVVFNEGDYKLTEEGYRALREIYPVLMSAQDKISYIRVEGYASPVEEIKRKEVKDLWELSGRRATEVVKTLTSLGFPKDKLVAVAYGDTRPLYSWKQSILMHRNNRVEIIIYIKREKT